ncbi:hypothetical protein [Micromonospora sp. L32]|uniref:hypothetical protein n=1 Tax=Micromonospora sp. L32 TaxID=3452214 RepID=UPI003F89A68A
MIWRDLDDPTLPGLEDPAQSVDANRPQCAPGKGTWQQRYQEADGHKHDLSPTHARLLSMSAVSLASTLSAFIPAA